MAQKNTNEPRTYGLLKNLAAEHEFNDAYTLASGKEYIRSYVSWKNRFRLYKVCWPNDEIVLFDDLKFPRIEQMLLTDSEIRWITIEDKERRLDGS